MRATVWRERLDWYEERVCSPRFHPHSDEPVIGGLGAWWCPSGRSAAISVTVSVLAAPEGGRGTQGGGAVAGTGRSTRIIFGSVELTSLDFFRRCASLPGGEG